MHEPLEKKVVSPLALALATRARGYNLLCTDGAYFLMKPGDSNPLLCIRDNMGTIELNRTYHPQSHVAQADAKATANRLGGRVEIGRVMWEEALQGLLPGQLDFWGKY